MLQNVQFQITIKKGAVNENLERNVCHEPVCNYTILWVIKTSQETWKDGLSFFLLNPMNTLPLNYYVLKIKRKSKPLQQYRLTRVQQNYDQTEDKHNA